MDIRGILDDVSNLTSRETERRMLVARVGVASSKSRPVVYNVVLYDNEGVLFRGTQEFVTPVEAWAAAKALSGKLGLPYDSADSTAPEA